MAGARRAPGAGRRPRGIAGRARGRGRALGLALAAGPAFATASRALGDAQPELGARRAATPRLGREGARRSLGARRRRRPRPARPRRAESARGSGRSIVRAGGPRTARRRRDARREDVDADGDAAHPRAASARGALAARAWLATPIAAAPAQPAARTHARGRLHAHGPGLVTERTLVLVKPDGVQRLLVGRILARYEERGLKLVGLKLVQVDRDLAERHYAVHREKPFFAGLVDFITSARSSRRPSRGPTRSRSSAR